MFEPSQYELIDFGDGVKVERFGEMVVARESPSVELFDLDQPLDSYEVDASYDSRSSDEDSLECEWHGELPAWKLRLQSLEFELRQTKTGQVGLFPEQVHNWDWIAKNAKQFRSKKAINLFGYSGGTTLALAAAGASVTHIDAASSVVSWARENASRSGLAKSPIRWIVEDAIKFVQREIKRGNQYDAFVADPPSFGRGTKKEIWKIDRDMDSLVELASKLCPKPTAVILSCHTPTWDELDLEYLLKRHFGEYASEAVAFDLTLETAAGRKLPSGHCARFLNKE